MPNAFGLILALSLCFLTCTFASTSGIFQQTRSLSGTPATDGNNITNNDVFNLLTLQLLNGFTVWRVKMYNDRVYLDRTRRSYWFGDRYYRLDNYYWLDTRDTCAYRMNETQRKDLKYEDGFPIYDIIYQARVIDANVMWNSVVDWTVVHCHISRN